MRSSEFRALLSKDCRELFGSTAFTLLLLVAGPLTGMSFIAAMRAYAEASGAGGGAAALASALSPLDGLLVPTLGALDLLITFLVPFVAIRLVSDEKRSGALTLLLQAPQSVASQLVSKLVALLSGWLLCLIPAFVAIALWLGYGGHLAIGETANLLLGHTLRYLLTCCVAIVAASLLDSAASAAIAVLSFTIGTWALDFFAAGRGGWIERLARYTPSAMLRPFERGLLSLDSVVASSVAALLLLVLAAAFVNVRAPFRARAARATVVIVAAIALLFVPTNRSADVSEDRRNSFPPADEALLHSIEQPLTIRMYLAAEDPRANDYERNVLTKLRRSVRELRVDYPYAGQSALFENDDRYGTIVYELGAKKAESRSTTEEIVLDELETLAGRTPPARGESSYPGYPLRASPRGAAVLFHAVWPLLIVIVRRLCSRRTG
ncbi:MAG TPA: ABC transporter permease [Thermoanaerobaculia bacterium]|nr:ABC transporter permease [Thermoanaerobaculia bacterium]